MEKEVSRKCRYCKKLALPNIKMCESCREKKVISNRKCYKERVENGLCTNCKKKIIGSKGVRCEFCKNKLNLAKNKRFSLKKINGLCSMCNNLIVEGSRLCKNHINYYKEYYTKKRKLNIENGICQDCSNLCVVSLDGKIIGKKCEICYLKTISKTHFGNVGYWKELKFLYENNPICPFTGIKLQLGINTSLDHIIPKSRSGLTEISNLQWVYLYDNCDINRMKGAMTNEEFLNGIKIIYYNLFKD